MFIGSVQRILPSTKLSIYKNSLSTILRYSCISISRKVSLPFMMESLPSSSSSSSSTFATTSTSSTTKLSGGPIQQMITQRITDALKPIHFEIENESYKHNVPKGSESHFKLFIVSTEFTNLSLIDRHRLVNTIIKGNDTNLPVHALSISAKTPAQWEAGAKIQDTPNCKGGSNH